MEEIQVKIKMTSNAQVYNVKITKSDTILKLKEEVEKQTQIPPLSQNLVYKGRILVNEKLVSDYNIENDHTIILVKNILQLKPNLKLSQPQQKILQILLQLQAQQIQIQIILLQMQIQITIQTMQTIMLIHLEEWEWAWEDRCQICLLY